MEHSSLGVRANLRRSAVVWVVVAAYVLALGCGPSGDGTSIPVRPVALATVSDGGDWGMNGGFTVRQECEAATFDLGLSGFGRAGEEGAFGFTVRFSPQQSQRLMAGAEVLPEGSEAVRYPVPGGTIVRRIESVRLTLTPPAGYVIDMTLGAPFVAWGAPTGALAPQATAHIAGSMRLSCQLSGGGVTIEDAGTGERVCSGIAVDDPDFASDLCRTAVREYGLAPLRQNQ